MCVITSSPNVMNSPSKNRFIRNIWPNRVGRVGAREQSCRFMISLSLSLAHIRVCHLTYLSHCTVIKIRKHSICKPTNCDICRRERVEREALVVEKRARERAGSLSLTLGYPIGSQEVAFSFAFFRFRNRCLCLGPS